MKYQVRNLVKKHIHYKIKKWKKQGSYDILHDIIENVILVQSMDNAGNVNHTVSIVGYCIFDSNYKKVLLFTIYLLNHICSPLIGEGLCAMIETLIYAFRYTNKRGN